MADVNVNVVGSLCVSETNFTVFITDFIDGARLPYVDMTQNQAIEECSAIGGSLGPIVNSDEYETLRDFIRSDNIIFPFDPTVSNHDISFYIGLQATVNTGDPDDFQFVSTDPNFQDGLEFYDVDQGVFPWAFGQPDNFDGNQLCGQMFFGRNRPLGSPPGGNVDGLVDDVGCALSHGFICRGFEACSVADPVTPVSDPISAPVTNPSPPVVPPVSPEADDLENDDGLDFVFSIFTGLCGVLFISLLGTYVMLKRNIRKREQELGSALLSMNESSQKLALVVE